MESNFKKYLKQNMTENNYQTLQKYCKENMSTYFGFYETLKVSYSPKNDYEQFSKQLTPKQKQAFQEAFTILTTAPTHIKETIRQFCHS